MNPDLLELDLDKPATKTPATINVPEAPALDLVNDVKDPTCLSCGNKAPVNDAGTCQSCYDATQAAAPDFSDIAANAAANAAAHNLGEDANGRATLGVGFHNATGYLEALKRGVAPATLRNYVATLKGSYNYPISYTETDSTYTVEITGANAQTFTAPILTVVAGNGAYEAESHASDEGIALIKARAAALQVGAAKASAEAARGLVVVPSDDVKVRQLVHGDLVAGAAAEGHGVLTHWTGSGSLTRGELVTVVANAEAPSDWLPKAKDPKTQANLAVTKVAAEEGLIVIREKRDWRKKDQAYDRRWTLSTPNQAAAAGEAAGTVAVVVTLDDGVLKFDSHGELSEKIEAEFKTLCDGEVFQAGHITNWLGGVIRDHLSGVKYGGSWYVPRESRATAEKLIASFEAANWGSDWMNPPLPVATSAQLAKGIANGLKAEVDDTLAILANDAKNHKNGQVGEKAAVTYLAKFKDHAARAVGFGAILGESNVADVKAKIAEAVTKLEGALDGISLRFARLWEEVEDDLARKAAPKSAISHEVLPPLPLEVE